MQMARPRAGMIHHVALNCRNRLAQEGFYSKHFGFKRSRTVKAGQPDEFVLMRLGDFHLELFPAENSIGGSFTGGEQTVGYKHLCFEIEKLEPAIEALRADGIETDPIIDFGHVVPGARLVFFRDPEGNILELLEGYRDEI